MAKQMSNEMTCRELVELVTAYLDGALVTTESIRFDAHIHACGPCGNHLEQMRLTIRLTGRLTEDSISAEAREALLGAFRTWKPGH